MTNYSRYSHHARRALTHAGLLATEFRHPRIDTGHLLVGVMLAEGSIGYTVLHELGLDANHAKPKLRDLTIALDAPPEILNNDAALDITLELASDESEWLGHHYIGTEHLLLGMTRTNLGNAGDLLRLMQISPEQVRRRVRRALKEGLSEFTTEFFRKSARYSELFRRVISAAEQISISLDHHTLGIGHVLSALLNERRGIAPTLLRQSGINEALLRSHLNHAPDELLLSIESLLDEMIDIADKLGNHYTGTEHLLLTLVYNVECVKILENYDVDVNALRSAVEEKLEINR